MARMNRKGGFTLIELMIVVVIIGILAAIAYPSYKNYVVKTRRADAVANVMELSQYMERFFTENGRYDEDRSGTAVTNATLPFTKSPQEGSAAHYNLGFAAAPSSGAYTLEAVPQGDQANSDTDCGTLRIDSTGKKCILGGAKCSDGGDAARAAVGDCW